MKQRTREMFNERVGRYLLSCDSLVPWEDGTQAHLQYSIDITESKKVQKELEYYSTMDDMTGTLNRKSLHVALRSMLQNAEDKGKPLSIVFIDLDNLKEINRKYGHTFGDNLINTMVSVVRKVVRRGDVVGRYGYDEFVLIMMGCNRTQAVKRITEARNEMMAKQFTPATEAFTFSFGVVENREATYGVDDRGLKELILKAEEHMRQSRESESGEAVRA